MKKTCGTFILLALLASCGENKVTENSQSFQIKPGETLSQYIDGIRISHDTPEGLGTLLTLHDGGNVGICTWFLIDKDHAMTN